MPRHPFLSSWRESALQPFANAVGIADRGAFAHRVEQHDGELLTVRLGAHQQAATRLVGVAGLGEAHVPVRVLHQGIGIVEHQAVGRRAEAHLLVGVLGELADQRLAIGGGDELGEIPGGGDVASRQTGGVVESAVAHAELPGLVVHGANEGRAATRVVAGEGRGHAILGGHQRQVQGIATAHLGTETDPGVGVLDVVPVVLIYGQGLIEPSFRSQFQN